MSQTCPPSTDARHVPLCVPVLRGNEWTYVKECLDTNWVSYAGPFVERFERDLAATTEAKWAVAMNSGTSALHIALLLAGVQPDSEVVMPDVTFVSPANAVRYCGAWPTLIDIHSSDWQMDVAKLEDFLARECELRGGWLTNRHTDRPIAAIMPVHILGGMADIDAIGQIAARYNLPLVEDAAECLGARYKGRAIGASPPGISATRRYVCTSFNGNKIITTGGGGALLTDDAEVARRAKHLSTTAKADPIEFFHDEIGYNYRLTNVAAALGVAQLELLPEYTEAKRAVASHYSDLLGELEGVAVHPQPVNCRSTFWLYTVMLDRPARPIVDRLIAQNIGSRPIWRPIHSLPAFQQQSFAYRCEFADRFASQALSLPCSVDLDGKTQYRVAAGLRQALRQPIDGGG